MGKSLIKKKPAPPRSRPQLHPFLQRTRAKLERPIGHAKQRAFDVEATGLDFWHGCLPFSMQCCDSNGILHFCEWDVDPFTRIPDIDPTELEKIFDLLTEAEQNIYHNPKIDIRAFKVACEHVIRSGKPLRFSIDLVNKWIKANWPKVQDTLTKSHALRNLWSHSLKDLRDVFLHISRDKQNRLKAATNEARQICKSKAFREVHGIWRIADLGDPHWPGIIKAPSEPDDEIEGWWLYDTWLPRMIWKLAPDFLPAENDVSYKTDEGMMFPDETPEKHLDHSWRYVLKDYALEDVESTLVLNEILDDALEKENLTHIAQRRHRAIQISYEMEEWGVPISLGKLQSEQDRYYAEADWQRGVVLNCAKQAGLVDFNPESHDQLRQLLYARWGLPILEKTDPSKRYPAGQPKTDQEVLKKLIEVINGDHFPQLRQVIPIAREFITAHLGRSQNQKAGDDLDQYKRWAVNHGPVRGVRVHTNFFTTGTKLTRWASRNPNLQNVGTGDDVYDDEGEKSKDFLTRCIFQPRPGTEWLSIDFQSIEYFIWGWECGNEEIRRVYAAGYSPFKPIMEAIWNFYDTEDKRYKKCKNGTYSVIYGAAEAHSDKTYGKDGAVQLVIARIPEVRSFTKMMHTIAKQNGYVTTKGGYRLYIPLDEPHKATSAFVQGHAGWVLQEAMINCHEYLERYPEISMILNIHDELIFEGPEGFARQHADKLGECMTRAGEKFGIPTPLNKKLIPYGKDWSQAVAL